MTSNNEEYPNFIYIEEEELEASENGFQPEVELKEIENNQTEVESDDIKCSENKGEILTKRIKKRATVRNSVKNSSVFVLPDGTSSSSAISNRGNRIILRKSNISPGSELLDKSALFDGTYFSLIGEHYKEGSHKGSLIRKFKGQCALCSVPVHITGTGSSTFNFLRHLRRKHGENVFQSYLSYRQQKNPRARTKNTVINKPTHTISLSNILQTIDIYVPEESLWKPFGNPRQKRPLSSIILEDDISNNILTDVRDFISSSSWYRERSIPYRRTYLLHGPSGCGKSSFVFALASELNYGLCVLNPCERELTDGKLNHLLNSTPENCIILLENIDDALPGSDKAQSSRLTLSGFLNCLDGVTAVEGRILFLTCVDKDRLDSSLLRSGRIDVKQYLGFCSQTRIAQLAEKFYDAPASCVLKFVQEVMKHNKNVSPVQIQGFFLSHKNNNDVLSDVQQIWDS